MIDYMVQILHTSHVDSPKCREIIINLKIIITSTTRHILAADVAPNGGGEGISLTTNGTSAELYPISHIHVSLVPGHKFPIDCGSQHGYVG